MLRLLFYNLHQLGGYTYPIMDSRGEVKYPADFIDGYLPFCVVIKVKSYQGLLLPPIKLKYDQVYLYNGIVPSF